MKTAAIFSATDHLGPFIEQFLPASQGLRMDHLVLASNELTLVLASSRTDACCPVCQEPSKRVHSRYQRLVEYAFYVSFSALRALVKPHETTVHHTCCRKYSCNTNVNMTLKEHL